MARARYSAVLKREAIALAVEVGPAEAAERLSIPPATLRSWCSRAGVATSGTEKTEAAVNAVKLKWAERRLVMVEEIGAAAHMALAQTVNALGDGQMRNAKDAATTMAILVDKAQLLSGGHTARFGTDADREQALEEAHGKGLTLVSDAA